MLFIEDNKKISVVVLGYQFPHANPNDAFEDANWLDCKFDYQEGEWHDSRIDACLISYEFEGIITALSDIIAGTSSSYHSDFLEPYLEIKINKANGKIKFDIQFEYDSRDDGKFWSVSSLLEVEEAIGILEEMKEFNRLYPPRLLP